jgi:ArsR family transcriptional regulator
MANLAALFKGLADETRLATVALLLRHGELCVCDLEHTLGVTQTKASRHLRYLEAAGLLEHRRGAQWVFYRIARNESAAQKAVVAVLSRLLKGQEYDELDRKLEQWRASKHASGDSCRVPAAPHPFRSKREAARP